MGIGLGACALLPSGVEAQDKPGRFEGALVLEPRDKENRDFIVKQPFAYIDKSGQKWDVPAGTITDGASVPRAFWSLFPPIGGRHLRAAVVHDRFCVVRNRDWRAVHLMFYEALLAGDVDEVSAKTMYMAVYAFGPRWVVGGGSREVQLPDVAQEDQEAALRILRTWIENNDPNVRQMDAHMNSRQIRETGARFISSDD